MSTPASRDRIDENQIPRLILLAAGALIVFVFLSIFIGRATDTGLLLTPEAAAVETRAMRFTPAPTGEMAITDKQSGQLVALLSAGGDGFIRGVLRGLSRGRAVTRTTGDDVYVLTRYDDGRLSISDPVSGARFDLNSFGPDNLEAFARLLKSREDAQ